MKSGKELSITFLSIADAQSAVHRCFMVSRELESRGYNSKYLFSGTYMGRAPKMGNHINNWKLILNEQPDILVLHRSSSLVDHEMIKRMKKLSSGTRIIFDYDDALFHTRLPARVVSHSHLNRILSMSDRVTAGSHYLKEFAGQFNKNVSLLPSPVDMSLFHPTARRANDSDSITIGWLGSGTMLQLPYLKILTGPLDALAQKYDFKLKIISALSTVVRTEFTNRQFEVDFGLNHWVPIEQIPELIADFDIGVMPLTNDPWSRGKCAMKLLEYMSMKLATVSSAVGENRYVIDHGCNGFLASNPREWIDDMGRLIVDPDLRKEFGENGYKTIKERYSLQVVVDTIEQIIKELNDTKPT